MATNTSSLDKQPQPPPSTGVFKDVASAINLSFQANSQRTLQEWIYTPIGIVVLLAVLYGLHHAIYLTSVHFPASVACMLVLFLFLLATERIWNARVANQVYNVLEIPAGFGLRFLNVFFTPSFILLPLSPHIAGLEVAKIIAVFLIGFFLVLLVTALFTRWLHLLLGTSKKAIAERSDSPHGSRQFDERAEHADDIPLATLSAAAVSNVTLAPSTMSVMTTDTVVADHDLATPPASGTQTPVHKPSRHDVQRPMTLPSRLLGQTVDETSHQDLVSERCKKLTAILVRHKDSISYSIIFVIGLPIYLVTGVGLPVQLGVNVLAYFVAFSLPQKQKKYIHPVLGCSALSIIGIWLLALLYSGIHGIPAQEALKVGLKEYSKGKKYLVLFDDANQSSGWQAKIPGAGDIFSSLLDIGIVGLGLPMFKYRQELKRHYPSIFIPAILFSTISLFAYPAVCHVIGISPARSLAFAARSLTLALATPATVNLHGDMNLLAALTIGSGIVGVLTGDYVLQLIKIPLDDYVTRGVTLGSVSSAITTAHLLTTDPRAAALSSLTLVAFGTWMIILTVIPPVVKAVWMIADFDINSEAKV